MESMQDRAALRLLLIEDSDTDFLLLERKMLKSFAPAHITRAANGTELADALKYNYDLIISDFHLPGAEGEALLMTIANAHPATPCILMSGSSYELSSVWTPASVIAKLEKGDTTALRAALEKACLMMGVSLNDN